MDFEVVNTNVECPTVIKVVGCGGGGSNAVNRMIEANIQNVEFIALNTDLQALNKSVATIKLPIGQKITQGLGCGGDPSVGEKAAEEDKEAITNLLKGSNMVFVTAGMGGGTGTGSAPVVARIAREIGALTVAIVTTPFSWEGPLRMNLANSGLEKLRQEVDSVIVIPNSKITEVFGNGLSFYEQYRKADDLLRQSIEGMSTIITRYGIQNIDFADVRNAMRDQGTALFGIGTAEGSNRAVDAATMAINNPILEDLRIDGAKHFLINVVGGKNFSLDEMNEITSIVCASAAPDYELKQGFVLDEEMEDEISVTVIATGFNDTASKETESERNAVKTEPAQENPNEVSSREWETILSGGDVAAVSGDEPALFDPTEDFSRRPNPYSQNVSNTGSFAAPRSREPQGGNFDPNDNSVPAILRKKTNGYSSTINLRRP